MKLFEIMGDITFDQDVEDDEEGPDYEEIVRRLVQDAEENGGFTVNANTFDDANLQDGYQVAIEGYETRASLDDFELMIESVQEINAFVNQQSSNDLYVGGWISDNELCLDVSQHVEDREFAISLGLLRGEEAIFDNATMEEISLAEFAEDDYAEVEDEYAPDELDTDDEFDTVEVGDEFGDEEAFDDEDEHQYR